MQSAMSAHASGRLDHAQDLCRQILTVNPRHVQAMMLTGVLASKTGQKQLATEWFRRVLSIESKNYVALNWMSMLSRQAGDITQATAFSELAASANPKDADVVNGLGLCYMAQGRFEDAVEWFEQALILQPRNPTYHANLGVALGMAGKTSDAIKRLRDALRIAPDPGALRSLVDLFLSLGDIDAAIDACRAVVAGAPREPAPKLLLASTLIDAGLAAEARAILDQFHDSPEAHEMLGRIFQNACKFEEAIAEYEEAVSLDQRRGLSYYGLVTSAGSSDDILSLTDRIEFALEGAAPNVLPTAHLRFALGAAMDRLSRAEEAKRQFDEANHICRTLLFGGRPFDGPGLTQRIDETIELFSAEFLKQNADPEATGELPLFVAGVVRSGASLLQDLLAGHEEIGAAGSQMFWRLREPDIVDAAGKALNAEALAIAKRQYDDRLRAIAPVERYAVDTSPTHVMQLGLLHLAFPRARIIHLVRDAAATIQSIYSTPVRNPPDFACDEANIAFAHEQFQRLMNHWRAVLPESAMLEVRIEDLVANPEPTLRRVLAFLGLEWDEACLHAAPARAPRTADFWHFRRRDYLGA